MIRIPFPQIFYCFVLLIFAACSTTKPSGPKISVMPAPGKPFDQFTAEDIICRKYAEDYIGTSPSGPTKNAVGTTIAGTALGTAAGALIGGRQGASTGAGIGLIGGSLSGAGQAGVEAHDVQWSYDNAYAQCMYAKGNQVPGYQIQQPVAPPLPPKK